MNTIQNVNQNPFAQFSAEEELSFLSEIFYQPQSYDELKELLSASISRFILGQRGQGKSMVIYNLFQDLSQNHTLPLLITRYDNIPLTNNENYLLYLIMQAITIGIAKLLFEKPEFRKKLTKDQETKLAFFIELFYEEHCASEFIESAKEIKKIKSRNRWCRIYNKTILHFLNSMINGTINITSQQIRQSLNLGDTNTELTYKEYFKEIPAKPINSFTMVEVASWDRGKLMNMLNFLIQCARSLDHDSIVVLFDKIDEFPLISSDIEMVANFTVEILKDTDLLLSDKISIVFSLWSEIKRALSRRGVRFDKFQEIDIRWTNDDLIPLINKRLLYFSKTKEKPVTIEQLVPNKLDRDLIIELSTRSPRSLIILLGKIFTEPINSIDGISFTSNAIANGMIKFCRTFDYESQQPSKLGNREDLINWIDKILRIRKHTFSIEDVNTAFLQKANISKTYIDTMLKLGLIIENDIRSNDQIQFDVIDPKLKFLISRGILKLEI